MSLRSQDDPHSDQPILRLGPEITRARGLAIFLHGRGSTAEQILSLDQALELDDIAAVAPQAARHTWYPNSFLAPLESNQPYLDSALRRIEFVIDSAAGDELPVDRIALVGFSQGACLVSEFIARNPRRYGAAVIFTGGLIGPPGTARDYSGSLEGTPVFLGTSDPDPHVPFERVVETKEVLERMSASVELRRYPGMPHTINEDELQAARDLLQTIGRGGSNER